MRRKPAGLVHSTPDRNRGHLVSSGIFDPYSIYTSGSLMALRRVLQECPLW